MPPRRPTASKAWRIDKVGSVPGCEGAGMVVLSMHRARLSEHLLKARRAWEASLVQLRWSEWSWAFRTAWVEGVNGALTAGDDRSRKQNDMKRESILFLSRSDR